MQDSYFRRRKSRIITSLLTILMYRYDIVLYDPKFRNASETCTVSHIQVETMLCVRVEWLLTSYLRSAVCWEGKSKKRTNRETGKSELDRSC